MLYCFGVLGSLYTWINLEGRDSTFLNRLCWFGVVGLFTLGLEWGDCLHSICPYFSIGSTGLV